MSKSPRHIKIKIKIDPSLQTRMIAILALAYSVTFKN
tara:strand:- start:16994 stop:17104 length:111 start_codon:yes stop_codon:yes gene_type:complete